LRTGFDGSLKLEFHGSRVTSDAGLLACREIDDALAPTTMSEGSFPEWRTGRNTQHRVVALFRQSICNGRGTAERWIREGRNAVKWTRLSCHDFLDNQARLQLFVLAYDLGNFLRRLARPGSVAHRPLTTLRKKLVKIGTKFVVMSLSDGRLFGRRVFDRRAVDRAERNVPE
jgi:hypothetical protein